MIPTAWLELDQIERVPLIDRVVIGRHASCDLVLPYPKLSRQHAMIFKDTEFFWITDLNSRNGTWVAHRRIRQPVRLRSGDAVSFDSYSAVFYQRTPTRLEVDCRLATIESNKATVCRDTFVTVTVGTAEVGPEGQLDHVDAPGERMLADFFGTGSGGGTLPPELAKWMRTDQSNRHPLCVRLNHSRLVVTRLVVGDRKRLILTEEAHYLSEGILAGLGLSLTEQRILRILAENRPVDELHNATSLSRGELASAMRDIAHKVKAPSVSLILPSLVLVLGLDGKADRGAAFNMESPLASQDQGKGEPSVAAAPTVPSKLGALLTLFK